MSQVIAPPPVAPLAELGDGQPLERVHFRLWQILMTAVTVIITTWLFTIHIAAGIIALFFAKHMLVAILAAGLRLPPRPPTSRAIGPAKPAGPSPG